MSQPLLYHTLFISSLENIGRLTSQRESSNPNINISMQFTFNENATAVHD
jgi:hypothetical protein